MENEPTPNGLTRRSFIKRSVVAAVAVSSMTIFSGLVNASSSGSGYSPKKLCTLSKLTKCEPLSNEDGSVMMGCMAKCDPQGSRAERFQVECDEAGEIKRTSNSHATNCAGNIQV